MVCFDKYHFSHIFANRFNNKEIESLFAQERKTTFKLDVLYSFEKHYELVDCMIFFVVKNSADVVVVLSEVHVRTLANIFFSISNDILKMKG